MANKSYSLVSTKLDSDIIEFMKLLKRKYGARTMSEGARRFYSEFDPETLKLAQNVAGIRENIEASEKE